MDMLMLNYAVPPELLEPFVPPGTSLDLLDGQAFASVVAFRATHVRAYRMKMFVRPTFNQINVRYYIHRLDNGQRGVMFLKELVSSNRVAVGARVAYREPYEFTPIVARVDEVEEARVIRYDWSIAGTPYALAGASTEPPRAAVPGTPESFFTERHWGYNHGPRGRTREYRVDHPPWPVSHARVVEVPVNPNGYKVPVLNTVLTDAPYSAYVVKATYMSIAEWKLIN